MFLATHGVLRRPSISFVNLKSLSLNGIDDFVTMGNVLNIERTDTFSFSAWVKKNDTGSSMVVLSKAESSGNLRGFVFLINTSNQLQIILRRQNQVTRRLIATSTDSLTAGVWSHIVVTYDGSSTEAGFTFYINGTSSTSSLAGSTLTSGSLSTTIPLQIGARNSTSLMFDGGIDEVAVFSTELSQSDVTAIYGSGVPSSLSSYSSMTSWWRSDGDISPTLTDNGSAGFDGTMTNFTSFSTDVPT